MAFLFYTILALVIIATIIITSKIRIEIENFKYTRTTHTEKFTGKKTTDKDNDILVRFKIYIFNIIPVTFLKLDNQKINKLRKRKMFVNIGNKLKTTIDKMQSKFINKFSKSRAQKTIIDILTIAKELKLKFREINLKINVGVSNVIATSFLIPLISTIISFFLRNSILDSKQIKYEINPIYNLDDTRTKINIYLKCIIEVKMIHIINIMYIIKKQRKVKEHARTSNRRAYDYSYE